MARFIHDGKSIDYTPSAAVTAGDVVVLQDLIGIAKVDIEANRLGALAVEGVFEMAKASGSETAILAGTKVYWNATASQVVSEDEGVHKYLGKAVATAGTDKDTVLVRLEQ